MENTTIRVLGCGDAFASGGRFNTCFYISHGNTNTLLDCGGTSLLALKQAGISTNTIDTIVISHFHGDHFGGLPYLLLDAYYQAKRTTPLSIITPAGGFERIRILTDLLYPGSSEIMNESLVSFKEYRAGEELRHLNLSLRTFVAFHAPESIPHSLRLSFGDKTIAFSGDTSWHSGLYEVARDADLFICEASCFKTEGKGHLSFKNLSEEKINFQCKQMLLTHLGAESLMNLPEIQEVFECAFDGKIIEL